MGKWMIHFAEAGISKYFIKLKCILCHCVQKNSRILSVKQWRRVLCWYYTNKHWWIDLSRIILLTICDCWTQQHSGNWGEIRFWGFTLESEGLFDGEWDPQQGEPVLQNLLPSSLLLYQLVHLCRLLESRIEPDSENIWILNTAQLRCAC